MAEKKQTTKVVDPLVAFIDIEGDPETEIAQREAELKAKGQDGPTKGSTDIGLKEGPGGEQDLPKQEPEAPETDVEAEARDEGPEEEEVENPEGLEAASEAEPDEKPQVKPWQRVKEMRKELKEERKAREVLEAKLAQIEARQQAQDQQRYEYAGQGQRTVEEPQQQEPKIPTYEDDPLGNLSYRLAVAEQRNQMSEQEIMLQRVSQRVNAEEDAFNRASPDYYAARNWVIQREYELAKAKGFDDRTALMDLEAKRQVMIASAWQQGRTVGEVVYHYAKALGYPGPQQAEQTNGNGKAQDDSAQERVRQAAMREKQASASLGSVPNTPGKTGGSRLTRARVMAMTQEEMDKLSDNDPNWMERVEM